MSLCTDAPPTVWSVAAFLHADDHVQLLRPSRARETLLTRPAPVSDATSGCVAFLTAKAARDGALPLADGPTLLILDEAASVDTPTLLAAGVAAVIRTAQPRLDFLRVVREFYEDHRAADVHPSAVIAPTAVLGPGVSVGPLCTIGEQCRVGDGSRLEAGVHLYDRVIVGRNVHIHSGAVIGADGFGYERDAQGLLCQFPHLGHVEIGDDVDIGANTCIDRGTLGVTRVRDGAKIDNLVHIGHNADVGDDSAIIALTLVGGSTRVGAGAWVSPSACLRDNIDIGDGATVGLAAVVTRDVAHGATVMGAPARDAAEFKALLEEWRRVLAEAGRR
jgi:UDP-3-O-[3-hydroxymyristoyl] glucosamine N-acyltransferase